MAKFKKYLEKNNIPFNQVTEQVVIHYLNNEIVLSKGQFANTRTFLIKECKSLGIDSSIVENISVFDLDVMGTVNKYFFKDFVNFKKDLDFIFEYFETEFPTFRITAYLAWAGLSNDEITSLTYNQIDMDFGIIKLQNKQVELNEEIKAYLQYYENLNYLKFIRGGDLTTVELYSVGDYILKTSVKNVQNPIKAVDMLARLNIKSSEVAKVYPSKNKQFVTRYIHESVVFSSIVRKEALGEYSLNMDARKKEIVADIIEASKTYSIRKNKSEMYNRYKLYRECFYPKVGK